MGLWGNFFLCLLVFVLYVTVCFSSVSYNKIPLAAQLKQQFVPHSSGGWNVEDQGLADSGCGEGHLPGLQRDALLCFSWQGTQASSLVASYKGTNPTIRTPPSFPHINLISSQRPPPSNTITLGLRLQHENVEMGDTNI